MPEQDSKVISRRRPWALGRPAASEKWKLAGWGLKKGRELGTAKSPVFAEL
jgi:hypothetical protein